LQLLSFFLGRKHQVRRSKAELERIQRRVDADLAAAKVWQFALGNIQGILTWSSLDLTAFVAAHRYHDRVALFRFAAVADS
jgi:hypothetical protein